CLRDNDAQEYVELVQEQSVMQSLRETRSRMNVGDEATDEAERPRDAPRPKRGRGTRSRALRPLSSGQLRERLLSIMDRKHHWAWTTLTGPGISKTQLKLHFQNEFGTYVRDFPVLLARIHGKNPPEPVRRMLAENIYEEDTGGLSFGRSHPEL